MALLGKVSLITGSTSGIGLGIAKALASKGSAIWLNGFGESSAIEAVMKSIRDEYKVQVHYDGADLSKEVDIERMMGKANAGAGLDILVNNAGIQHVSPIVTFPVEKWNQVMAINLSAVFHTTRLAIPSMTKKQWGRIINIASVHGLVGSVDKSAYVAAKHGVIGLTKVTALELAKTKITCNAICPGWVLTPLVQQQIDAKAKALNVSESQARELLLSEKQPSVQFATPSQLGELACFMASDAASEVRGVAWTMDGAWTSQ